MYAKIAAKYNMQREERLLLLLLNKYKKKIQFCKVWYPPVPSTPKDVKFGESAVEEPLPFQTALSQMCTNGRDVRERRLAKFRQNVARFRLYRLRFLQENMRFAAFFKIYQILKLKFLKFDKILQILRHLQFFC